MVSCYHMGMTATKLYTETEAADPTSHIPMTSPNGRRTQYVSTEKAEQLAAKGWYRSKCEW